MDITDIKIINKEITLFNGDIKVGYFRYENFREIRNGNYIFNKLNGELSIQKINNMLVFEHDEHEIGCIIIYVKDSENTFYNIIKNFFD